MRHTAIVSLVAVAAGVAAAYPIAAQEYIFRKPIVGIGQEILLPPGNGGSEEDGESEPENGTLSISGQEYPNNALYGFTIENGKEPLSYSYVGNPPADRADDQRFLVRVDRDDCGGTFCYERLNGEGMLGIYIDRDMLLTRTEDDVEPGIYHWGIQVRDATGKTAIWETTTAFAGDPIVLARSTTDIFMGVDYDASDRILDLSGGYGEITVTYTSPVRVPGLDIVGSQIVGTPSQTGTWTLSVQASDESGQAEDFDLTVNVMEESCGLPEVFSTVGTFTYTPPEGCGTLFVEAWGGGANGVQYDGLWDEMGRGGGGGAYAAGTIVGASGSYSVTVAGPGSNSAFRQGGADIILAWGTTDSSGGSQYGSKGDTVVGGRSAVTFRLSESDPPIGSGGKAGGPGGGVGGISSEYGDGEDGVQPGGGGAGSTWRGSPGSGAPGMVRVTPSH